MKPEEKVEIILWDWLKTKGENVLEIYFNRTNKINCSIFQVGGEVTEKPDMVLKIDRGYGIEYVAIEVKDSNKRKNVLDAGKIFRYHKNFREGKTKYFINGNEININHFLIATDQSIEGHLLKIKSEGIIVNNLKDTKDDQWRRCLAKWGFEPKFEYFGTAQLQRTLFAQFREERKNYKLKKSSSIGILIAEIINDEGDTNKNPFMFIMNYNDYNPNMKKKWGCRFWRL